MPSYGGEEHEKSVGCEILTGHGFQWVPDGNGRVPENAVQVRQKRDQRRELKPLQGGHESNGNPLFVARGKVDGVDSIGMVSIPNYKRVNIMQKMINR